MPLQDIAKVEVLWDDLDGRESPVWVTPRSLQAKSSRKRNVNQEVTALLGHIDDWVTPTDNL